MPKDGPVQTNTEDLLKQINVLREEFKNSHGEDVFEEHYIRNFNEKPSMRANTFNRDAQPFLMGLFLCVVLKKGKELQDLLIDSFTTQAEKPWAGQTAEFTSKTRDRILYDMQDTIDKLAYSGL